MNRRHIFHEQLIAQSPNFKLFRSPRLDSKESFLPAYVAYNDKKEKKIFIVYKEIQMGAVVKSYMWKGFLILYMRKSANI